MCASINNVYIDRFVLVFGVYSTSVELRIYFYHLSNEWSSISTFRIKKNTFLI